MTPPPSVSGRPLELSPLKPPGIFEDGRDNQASSIGNGLENVDVPKWES